MAAERQPSRIWRAIGPLLVLLGISTVASSLQPGFTETVIASGLANPTAMAFAPDGRLFVCQQGGQLRVIENGVLQSTPFLTVQVSSSGERGLLGVAMDPNFSTSQFVYVYYTATSPTVHNRVSRFTANGNVAVAGSEVILLELNALSSATNHNGGAMHFDLDGTLYVAAGDNANGANAPSLSTLLGKILRINADGSIPTNNPFYTQTTGVNRAIWARGLRNPFTFAIDPVTGRRFINDVGQQTWEEINEGSAGADYGWPSTEGTTTSAGITSPVYAYGHGTGPFLGCAIAGGTFYSGVPAQFPSEYAGDYFFADYCGGWINQLDTSTGVVVATFASGISNPVDLAAGPEGGLYYLARGNGSTTGVVARIDFTGNQVPTITGHPASLTVSAGQPATFTVQASGTTTLSYQWQRNTVDIAGATTSSYTLSAAAQADSGSQFRCVVSNSGGTVTSNSALLTVMSGNGVPTPTIVTPATGTLYTAGTTLSYSGTATDPEDGSLAASRFTWQIDFHHDTHTHPAMAAKTGAKSGSFSIPNQGETSANVWYRVRLTVVDSAGQEVTTTRDVVPRTAQVTLSTSQAGLTLTLDGQPVVAPFSFVGVAGVRRSISAVSPQTQSGSVYTFRFWSDLGARTHTITTPSSARTFTATYRRSSS